MISGNRLTYVCNQFYSGKPRASASSSGGMLIRHSDYRVRACIADVAPSTASESTATFEVSERRAMIQEAHRLGVKVCTHATEGPTLQSLIEDTSNNVNSIEHGFRMSHVLNHRLELLDDRTAAPIFWVSTLR